MDVSVYFILEIIGTIAFAVSGAMVATEKKMDIFGVIILGVTTAVGGGITRDILTGVTPPASLSNPLYALIAIAVSIFAFLPSVRKRINVNSMVAVVIDAMGLGTFTVIGIKAAAEAGLDNVLLQVFLGVLTGVGGGVMRDLFAREMPMIFVKHFYAAASTIGALCSVLIYPYHKEAAMIIGILVIVILRILAAKYRWNLPKA